MIDWILARIYDITDSLEDAHISIRNWLRERQSWLNEQNWTVFNFIRDFLKTILALLIEWEHNLLIGILELLDTLYDIVDTVVRNAVSNITNFITNVVNNITNVWNTFTTNVSNFTTNVINNITNVIGLTLSQLGEWFADIRGATKSWVEGLFVKVKDVWNTITSNLEEWWQTKTVEIDKATDTKLAPFLSTFELWQGVIQDFKDFFANPLLYLTTRVDWIAFWTEGSDVLELEGYTDEARDEIYAGIPEIGDSIDKIIAILDDEEKVAESDEGKALASVTLDIEHYLEAKVGVA